jgi:glycine/D-amino acid oxidase-like deaminating enzyme
MTRPNINTFAPVSGFQRYTATIPVLEKGCKITVIGAGAFGCWSAYFLQKRGFHVTLIDAWGAGNSRSSSGDETRVTRSTYGNNEVYFNLNVRALQLWKEYEKKFNTKLFHSAGVLWFCYEEKTPLIDDSIPIARKQNIVYEYLNLKEIKDRYPFVETNDLHHAYFDPSGGYLKARESCQLVKEHFVLSGGKYIQQNVLPGEIQSGKMRNVKLSSRTEHYADVFLFACGAWLGTLFPDVLGNIITCTKQEVYYFGVPEDRSGIFEHFPAWVDVDGKDFYYGISGNAGRGFKIGVDKRGEKFDPTTGERIHNPNVLQKAREFIAHRFPVLQNAPLLESRVCPYENSPDGNFIFDSHPLAGNVLFLGGGSGHGFKHGPALGERVSQTLIGEQTAPEIFSLSKYQ